MPAPLSIVIPTLNAARSLPVTIDALLEGLQVQLVRELIICDGGSSDNVGEIADSVGARLLTSGPGRGMQLARGAAVARGEWLLFLHADTILDPGWSSHVARHIASDGGKAGYFRLRFSSQGLMPAWFAGWANLRSRMFSLPYGDQGLLIRRDLYQDLGGFPDIPLMEDVAMARKLRGLTMQMNCHATTSATSYQRRGWLRGGCMNLILLTLYLLGVKPGLLARWYSPSRG